MTNLTQKIQIDADYKDILFDGIDFSHLGSINIIKANSISIKNSRIYNINGSESDYLKQSWLSIESDIPVLLNIEYNFFGSNTNIDNLVYLNCQLNNKSNISSNFFKTDSTTNRYVEILGVTDNATIDINKNYFEKSHEGAIKLSMKGAPVCTINFNNNTISEASGSSEMWEGLFCVSPYGKESHSFTNCSINMNKNIIPTTQVAYAYYINDTDTTLTEDLCPTVYLDGGLYKLPIIKI